MATMISPLFLMRVPSADMKERVTFDPDGRSPIRDQQGEFGDVSIIPDTQPPVTSLNMLKSLLIFVDALISYLIPTFFIILFVFFAVVVTFYTIRSCPDRSRGISLHIISIT
ncbi:hypothetical protein OUZ56_002513 [Daphnia magna]|uniref:Uncharacterized protein n=1 Tax=Daphnia magna TaxID=35525 RepID=A0ABR0A604_9CRUS|nr:hypothetical protein OUZ56_002513 [Daphnia magna]